jgi:hypothetical protein
MPTEEEEALLKILDAPEIPLAEDPEMLAEIAGQVETAFPEMDEKQRRVMEKVITTKMPTPEEIAQAEQIAIHNAKVERRRQENLAKRRARQAAQGKRKRRQ